MDFNKLFKHAYLQTTQDCNNMKPIPQKQDKSKVSTLKKTVKMTDKKDNEKKREGIKDRR